MKFFRIAFHLFVLAIIIEILVVIYRGRCVPSPNYHEPILIAHAGGEIDGYVYTNCVEAVEKSIKDGFKAFELDLCLTADSQIIATHDWLTFNKQTRSLKSKEPMKIQELSKLKLYGLYTPFTLSKIDSLLICNPQLIFVTDKISSPTIIKKYFSKYKDRMFIECMSIDDYFNLKECGFSGVAFSGSGSWVFLWSELKYLLGLTNKRIERIVWHTDSYNKYMSWWCSPKSFLLWGGSAPTDYPVSIDIEGVYVDNINN